MEAVIKQIVDLIQKGNYLAIAIVIVFAILFNIAKISKFLEERKVSKKVHLDSLKLDDSNNTAFNGYDEIKQFLNEQRVQEYFYIATDLNLDVMNIKKLISFYRGVEDKFTFSNIKLVMRYLNFESDIEVDISWRDSASYWLNIFIVGLLIISGLLLFISVPILELKSIVQVLVIFLIAILVLGIAIFIWIEFCVPYYWANKLKKHLDTVKNKPENINQVLEDINQIKEDINQIKEEANKMKEESNQRISEVLYQVLEVNSRKK